MAQEIDKIIKSTTPPKSKDVLWDNGKELLINRNGKWESTGRDTPMINITYAKLVELRNNNKLVAGMQYRITDYVTTTVQNNTRSAGHLFDIIVTADNEKTLNEVARACRHEFDLEKYKDAFSASWQEHMTYVGMYQYEGKKYYLYESDSKDLQMLMDFNSPNVLEGENTVDYPYTFWPMYGRQKEGSWGEWLIGGELGESIDFKYNLAKDTYFFGSNLEAWQIWYSLDNDAERFAWAISADKLQVICHSTDSRFPAELEELTIEPVVLTEDLYLHDSKVLYFYDLVDGTQVYFCENGSIINEADINVGRYEAAIGKGVIYRMIDEWNNDCPYDFKNIQFKRNLSFDNGYAEFSEEGDETWVYTFAGQSHHINNDRYSDMLDGSLESPFGHMTDEESSTFHDNTIKPYIMLFNNDEIRTECGLRYLNDIVFLGYWEKIGSATEVDMPFYYAFCCYCNSFENDCHSNSFGKECCHNSFDSKCRGNSFSNNCSYNNFEAWCIDNSFMSYCNGNIFGYNCCNNIFGASCSFNSFRNHCSYNSFRQNCSFNSLEVGCYNNSLGADCCYNSFGNNCSNNSFVDIDGIADYVTYNQLDDGVQYVTLYYDENNGNYSGHLKNHHICRGVKKRTIEIYAGRDYETSYAINSNGDIVEFVLADLKNS